MTTEKIPTGSLIFVLTDEYDGEQIEMSAYAWRMKADERFEQIVSAGDLEEVETDYYDTRMAVGENRVLRISAPRLY